MSEDKIPGMNLKWNGEIKRRKEKLREVTGVRKIMADKRQRGIVMEEKLLYIIKIFNENNYLFYYFT